MPHWRKQLLPIKSLRNLPRYLLGVNVMQVLVDGIEVYLPGILPPGAIQRNKLGITDNAIARWVRAQGASTTSRVHHTAWRSDAAGDDSEKSSHGLVQQSEWHVNRQHVLAIRICVEEISSGIDPQRFLGKPTACQRGVRVRVR